MSTSTATTSKPGLPEHAAPFFSYAMELLAASDPGTLEDVRSKSETLLREYDERNRKARFSERTSDHAGVAMAALLDEVVLTSSWDMREDWMVRPLAFERYDDLNAGESFYTRLEDLRREAKPGSDEIGALEVFATSLALGFRGDQIGEGGERKVQSILQSLIAQIQEGRSDDSTLSPNATVSGGPTSQLKSIPLWMIGGGIFLFVALFSLILHWMAHSAWSDVAEQLTK